LQLIEHLDNNRKVEFIQEVHRLLKFGGIFHCEFPPLIGENGVINPYFFTDPTHKAWWMYGTFFCFDQKFRNQDVNKDIYESSYHININFGVKKIEWISNFNLMVEMIKLGEGL
jgi:hypothetical protein